MRTTDHSNNISSILIIGSFSSDNKADYNQHYIFCGINVDNLSYHFDALPDSECVSITSSVSSSFQKKMNITWSARGFGHFKFGDNECSANFRFKGCNSLTKFKNTFLFVLKFSIALLWKGSVLN